MKNAAFDTSFVVAAKQHAGAFIAEITGVLGVVFATVDGFDITHATLPGLDASRVAATASSISAIGSAVTSEFDMGASRNVSIRTEHGFVFILNGHSDRAPYLLSVIADASAVPAQVVYRAQHITVLLQKA
jgi:uncharacterized protein